MNSFQRSFQRIALAVLFICSSGSFASSVSLQKLADSTVAKTGFPAIGVALIENGRSDFAVSGVRKIGQPERVTLRDKWHIGSMTKSMTSVLIAKLVDDGVLAWDQPLKSIFNFPIHKNYADLNLKHLLTHAAGIDDALVWNNSKFVNVAFKSGNSALLTRELVTEEVLSNPAASTVGKLKYSNIGYMIAGYIAEYKMGKNWQSLLTEHVLQPLKLNSCGFGPSSLDKQNITQPWGHRRNEKAKIISIEPGPTADNHPAIGPAGRVHCDLQDLGKYVQFHLDNINGRRTDLNLKSATVNALYSDPFNFEYAVAGLVIADKKWAGGKLFWHNGSNTMNYSVMILAPKIDKALIGTTNFGEIVEAQAIHTMLKELQ